MSSPVGSPRRSPPSRANSSLPFREMRESNHGSPEACFAKPPTSPSRRLERKAAVGIKPLSFRKDRKSSDNVAEKEPGKDSDPTLHDFLADGLTTAKRKNFAAAIFSPFVDESFQALSLSPITPSQEVARNLDPDSQADTGLVTTSGPAQDPLAVASSADLLPHISTAQINPEAEAQDILASTTSITSFAWSAKSANETPLTSAGSARRFDLKQVRPMKPISPPQKNTPNISYGNINSILTDPTPMPAPNENIPPTEPGQSSLGLEAATAENLNVFQAVVTDTTKKRASTIKQNALHIGPKSPILDGLASPCFVHHRFDQVLDVAKVIEDMQDSDHDTLSHTRLAKTAIGVREISRQLQRKPIHRPVRTVLIVTKARDNSLVDQTKQLTEWLLSVERPGDSNSTSESATPSGPALPIARSSPFSGITVYVDAKLRNSSRFDALSIISRDPTKYATRLRFWTPEMCDTHAEMFDLVLTLGGDGTVLFTSWLFQRVVPPVLSFSLGSLGFLTNFDFRDHEESVGPMVRGDAGMRVSLRMRFTCTVYRAAQNSYLLPPHTPAAPSMFEDASAHIPEGLIAGEQYQVLNELVVDRGPSPYVSNLEVYGDNSLITVVQADGCIFSTPTGSTAYSLAAGGSLVHPDIPALLLTPICPHTLSFRPMLLNDTVLLRVSVPATSRAQDGAFCSFDGKSRTQLLPGDSVTISASRYPFPSVQSSATEWFDSLRGPLLWNSRTAQKGWDQVAGGPKEAETFDIDFTSLTEDENTKSQREYEDKLIKLVQGNR